MTTTITRILAARAADQRPSPRDIDAVLREARPAVLRIARRYRRALPGIELDDLVQAGFLGVWRALATFDPEGGAPWTTYAWRGARNEIARDVRERGRLVRVPGNLQESYYAIRRARRRLGSVATDAEVAREAGVPVRHVARCREAFVGVVSLDDELAPGLPWRDAMASSVPRPDALVEARQERDRVVALLSVLPARTRDVLVSRVFGGDSLAVTGRVAAGGVSRERARQIEHEGLRALRRRCGVSQAGAGLGVQA